MLPSETSFRFLLLPAPGYTCSDWSFPVGTMAFAIVVCGDLMSGLVTELSVRKTRQINVRAGSLTGASFPNLDRCRTFSPQQALRYVAQTYRCPPVSVITRPTTPTNKYGSKTEVFYSYSSCKGHRHR
ncbi:hypothetical protein BDZ45DRAFT_128558 [Acephala macrosclerotiorum]|nr:hypothetical protein BDZ45DRAFT_128558 [Acephala macrosclerotiorum]